MRLIPVQGRADVPFGMTCDEVRTVLGVPEKVQSIDDIESHPKGRRTLTYGNFTITVGTELGVFGINATLSVEPLLLWDTRINDLSPQELASFLETQGGRAEIAPPTPYGSTDVFSEEFGVLAYFANDRMSEIGISIPYSCPTIR